METIPTTRCKFRCDSVKALVYGSEVELNAVGPDPQKDGYAHGENHAFFSATPTGKFTALITNAHGAELFQPGKSYYLDVIEAPA